MNALEPEAYDPSSCPKADPAPEPPFTNWIAPYDAAFAVLRGRAKQVPDNGSPPESTDHVPVRSLTVRRYGVTLLVVPDEPEELDVSGDDDPVEPDEHAANNSELIKMGTIAFRIDIGNPLRTCP